jgi:hypothetical protein
MPLQKGTETTNDANFLNVKGVEDTIIVRKMRIPSFLTDL